MVLQSSITLEEPKRAGCERPQELGVSPSSRPTTNLNSFPRARPWSIRSGEGVLKPWTSDRRTVCRDDFGESGGRGVQTQVGGQEKDEVAPIALRPFPARASLDSALISLLPQRSSRLFRQRPPRRASGILQQCACLRVAQHSKIFSPALDVGLQISATSCWAKRPRQHPAILFETRILKSSLRGPFLTKNRSRRCATSDSARR